MGEGVLTAGFRRVDGALHCDGVSLEHVASAAGTPSYVYSAGAIREQYQRLDAALQGVSHRIHYSVKANSNLALLASLQALGSAVDIVSVGELRRALRAGFVGTDVVFSGVGKTEAELREAIDEDVLMVNVESEAELHTLDAVARTMDRVANVALRVNPEVMVDTPHPYTRTGEKGMKFGIPSDEILAVARTALAMRHLRLVGLAMHIGSQVSRIEPYQLGLARLLELVDQVRAAGARDLRWLDVGGGLAVTYHDEVASDVDVFASMLISQVGPTGLELIVEPGRFLVGNAGVLLTRVLYRKRSGGKDFAIVDAGMNDLLRPSHYNAYHRIDAVSAERDVAVLCVVGPVCESGDFIAMDREMVDAQAGDLLAVHSTGAYGFVMASNYNSRPRPAEVLVDGERWAIVGERESLNDLMRQEPPRPEWRTD